MAQPYRVELNWIGSFFRMYNFTNIDITITSTYTQNNSFQYEFGEQLKSMTIFIFNNHIVHTMGKKCDK